MAPAEVTALSTVRIDIKDLMILLRDGYPRHDSTIRITLTPPSHTGAPQQSMTVSTEKLLRQTFLLLSDYIIQAEEELSESPGITTVKALLEELDPFPDLWIDGYGNLLHASTANMDAPLEFAYRELGIKELGVFGYSRATNMDWMYEAFTSNGADDDITWDYVIRVWRSLRMTFHWDWNIRTVPPGLKKLTSDIGWRWWQHGRKWSAG